MKTFQNMEQYTEWVVKEALKLSKYDKVFVRIESVNKILCVCGTPLAIEYIAERSAEAFIKEWSETVDDEYTLDDVRLDIDSDRDLVSELRDKILDSVQKYLKMEIVYISTEY